MRTLAISAALLAIAAAGTVPPAVGGAEPPDVLVSRQLAAKAHLLIGDIVTIAADANGARARSFRVAGIYEPTPDPMRFTAERIEGRLHLPDLLDIVADPSDPASRETVNVINVTLTDPNDARSFAADLGARSPGIAVRPTARARDDDPFVVLKRFHVAISVVTMIGGTAFLLALMVIRAEERRETIGILRLVGISRRTLLGSVAVEGLVVAAIGATFGVVLAYLSESIVNRVFQARYDTALVFVRVTPWIAARAIAVAAPLGVLAGVGASWTLLRREVLSIFHR